MLDDRETSLRLAIFVATLLIMSIWEFWSPRRVWRSEFRFRRLLNLALMLFNTLCVRLILPLSAAGLALIAEKRQWGLLHYLPLSSGVALVISLILLDLAIYLQHIAFHRIPILWQVHRLHHADEDVDVTTGVRFHPIEILLSALFKLAVVLLIGPSVECVIVFEILLNAMAMFNHSNVFIPTILDKLLRRLIVTPDMHRIHHSIYPEEQNTNFGFNLSCWDYLFGSYKSFPRDGQIDMTLGISENNK
jgi:sterol desaturase/sphingolipid hydroxylase (fatty acid hydroxylase superfamily)